MKAYSVPCWAEKHLVITQVMENKMRDLLETFDKLFDSFEKVSSAGYPKLNVFKTNSELIVQATVVGVEKEDLNIVMHNNRTLEIAGKTTGIPSLEPGLKYYIRDISHRDFSRSVYLGQVGEPKSSTVKNGLLTLRWDLNDGKMKKKIECKYED